MKPHARDAFYASELVLVAIEDGESLFFTDLPGNELSLEAPNWMLIELHTVRSVVTEMRIIGAREGMSKQTLWTMGMFVAIVRRIG
jgi:hypothetical protein